MFYVCKDCWGTEGEENWGKLINVPNLVRVHFRNISKINVKCEKCGRMTSTPVKVEVSNKEIENE